MSFACGLVACIFCPAEWVAVSPIEVGEFECPKCKRMGGRRVEPDDEEDD